MIDAHSEAGRVRLGVLAFLGRHSAGGVAARLPGAVAQNNSHVILRNLALPVEVKALVSRALHIEGKLNLFLEAAHVEHQHHLEELFLIYKVVIVFVYQREEALGDQAWQL